MSRPSFQFYPKDWRNNANLGRCSFAARGVWVDVMCVLHDSDEYGVIRWPLRELANSAKVPINHLRELVDKGVLKGIDKGDCEPFIYTPRSGRRDGDPVALIATQPGPIWYSSRMVKDEYVRANAGAATRFGANDPPAAHPADAGTERAKLRNRVFEKTGGACHHCSKPLAQVWEIDHLLPRSKGGRHTFANMVPACVGCNQDKSDTMPDDWAALSRSPSPRRGDGPASSSASASSPAGLRDQPAAQVSARPPDERPVLALVGDSPQRPKTPPDCPHLEVLALWAEVLPHLPQHEAEQWKGQRADHLRARWREVASKRRWTAQAEGLAYLRRLFAYVGRSDFLTGRKTPRDPNRKPFVVTLAWLVKPENWAKTVEGEYHEEATA